MPTRTDTMEREVKFAAAPGFELPDLRKLVATERLPAQSLATTYYDTPDMRLWRQGLTLRFRAGEGDEGDGGKWTLKVPEESVGPTLGRSELSWAGDQDDVPAEAAQLLVGLVRRATLGRVVQLSSTRRRLVLRDRTGSALGEIDDDTVTVAGGARDGFRFRQIEFEFANDTEAEAGVIDAVLKKIERAGARPDHEQKFAKSLGLGAEAGPSAPKKKAKKKHGKKRELTPLGAVVQDSIGGALDGLLDHDYRLRLAAADPVTHDVHQARVACRRLRSDLKTFRPLLDPVWLRHTTDELRWFGTVLGQVRDADVLGHRLDEARPDGALAGRGHGELLAQLAEERRLFAAELAEVMDGPRYISLLERLAAAAQAPPFYAEPGAKGKVSRLRVDGPARDALPLLVRTQWKALQRRKRKAGAHPSDHQLHRIRIGAKQLRYAAEAATPVMGSPARRTARRAELVQTVLGDHHDAVAAADWLERAAAGGSGAVGFAAGVLTVAEHRHQRTLRRQWKGPWAALNAKAARQWLR
jgi:CHAD domain-containing protein